jgi:beta-glucosidase
VGQIPTYYRHHPTGGQSRWKGRYADGDNRPLWPFGHGLSLTTFELSNLLLDRPEVGPEGSLEITVEVANTGDLAGDEVVQLYVRDVRGSVTRPVMQLEGFARVTLDPGSRARVSFRLPIAQLAFHDAAMRRVVEPGTWEIMVGTSSEDLPLRASFEVTGETTVIARPPILGETAIEYLETEIRDV